MFSQNFCESIEISLFMSSDTCKGMVACIDFPRFHVNGTTLRVVVVVVVVSFFGTKEAFKVAMFIFFKSKIKKYMIMGDLL